MLFSPRASCACIFHWLTFPKHRMRRTRSCPVKQYMSKHLFHSAHTQYTTLPITLSPRAPPESGCNSYTHFHKKDAESGGACLSFHLGGWGRRIVPDQPVSINKLITTFLKCNVLEYLTIPSKSFHSAFSPLRKDFVYFILNQLKYMELTTCKLQKWLTLQFGAHIMTFKHIRQNLHYWGTALADIAIL